MHNDLPIAKYLTDEQVPVNLRLKSASYRRWEKAPKGFSPEHNRATRAKVGLKLHITIVDPRVGHRLGVTVPGRMPRGEASRGAK